MRILFTVILFTLCSCNFGGKEVQNSNSNVETTEPRTSNASEKIVDNTWKGWQPPSKLDGYTLDTFIVDPYKLNNLYSAMAVYKKGDKIVRAQIVDGSTDKGKSEIRDHLKIANQNVNSESEYGYEKIVDHLGTKANEQFLQVTGEYMVKFMYKEKYGCTIKSNAESSEAVWNLIDQLQLDALQ